MKKQLRKEVKERLKVFPHKKEESLWIVEKLLALKEYQEAETILAFVPMKSEPDISPLLADERIALPYIEKGLMEFSSCKDLIPSSYGTWEPKDKTPVSYKRALVLVPMQAYDETLLRMGRGGGYYDRYLAKNKDRLITVGVAYSVSKVDKVPEEWNDLRLDKIISPGLSGKHPQQDADPHR